MNGKKKVNSVLFALTQSPIPNPQSTIPNPSSRNLQKFSLKMVEKKKKVINTQIIISIKNRCCEIKLILE